MSEQIPEHDVGTRERSENVRPRDIQGLSDGNGQVTQQGGETTSRGLHGEVHTEKIANDGIKNTGLQDIDTAERKEQIECMSEIEYSVMPEEITHRMRQSRDKAAAHQNSKNTKKWSQTSTENNKQEAGGRQPLKSTTDTEVHAKAENADERNENKEPDIVKSSKQGQWTWTCRFLILHILIITGIVFAVLYHGSLSAIIYEISNEKVISIIKSNLEEYDVSKCKKIMEEEENKFRSSYLKTLELKITNLNKKVELLDIATKELQGMNRNAERNLMNSLSQQEDVLIHISRIKTDLERAEKTMKTIQADAKRTLDEQVTLVKNSIEELHSSQEQLDERNYAILIQSREIGYMLKQLTKDQQNINKEHYRQTQELTSLIQHIENTKHHLNKQLATAETKLTSLTSSLGAVDSRLNQTKNLTIAVDSLQSKYEEKVEPNLFNKGYFLTAFMLLFVLVLILMVSHYRLYQRIKDAEQGNRFQNKPKRSSTDILSQVPSKPQLQAAVCIISFDEGRQEDHQQLLDSANLPNCRVVTFVVRRHANIPDLPKCKVYLMCTEFTERHVIIEEQGIGLGDLHRTTFDAVLKLGGQLIILYTRDPESRRLKDDEVYNKNIDCVTHQEELVELNNMGRFFSVYDTLTAQQKTKLRKTIMDCLQ